MQVTCSKHLSISIIIPVLNAAKHLPALFQALQKQKPSPPKEIVIVDSGSNDQTVEIASQQANTKIITIKKFSHGKARNLGAQAASGDIVVLMTQDAEPYDEYWLSNLLVPFSDSKVAATYSRQIPRADASFTECFFLTNRFPPGDPIHRKKTPQKDLGFEDVFFSNVSSAIRRQVLLTHPFDEQLIMSEDQQFSRNVLEAGYAVVYTSDSIVIHSHNYNLKTVFQRYFDSVYSLTQIFHHHGLRTSSSIGKAYLKKEIKYVIQRHPRKIPYYICYTTAKIAATILAHCTKLLPRVILRRLSLHKYYW